MDLPLTGAVLLLGASLGSSWIGERHIPPLPPTPCVCQCECNSDCEVKSRWSFAGICLFFCICTIVAQAYCMWFLWKRSSLTEQWTGFVEPKEELSTGKGKSKGVLGQVAITLTS